MNLAVPVHEGFFSSILCDGCRPKLYKGEQKKNGGGVPIWLLRVRLMPSDEGSPYPIWCDVSFPAPSNPFPRVDVPFGVLCDGLRLNIGENEGKKYWSFAADAVNRA